MKTPTKIAGLFVVLMCALVGLEATADPFLGTINVTDGGTASNATTTCLDAGRLVDGGLITVDGGNHDMYNGCGFTVTPKTWITAQCRQNCFINTDVATCSGATCPVLLAEQWLSQPATLSKQLTFTRFTGRMQADEATPQSATALYSGGLVSVSPADGGSACTCQLWAQPEPR